MGWEAKSKGVGWRPCQADKEGLGFQGRTVFKVSSMCGRRSGHRLDGKETWQAAKTERM